MNSPGNRIPVETIRSLEQDWGARSLNLTLRTMQRKLKEEGATFRELFDDTRRRLADQYSKDSTLSSSELAYLLGFSEASSLRRAMKRWNVSLNGPP